MDDLISYQNNLLNHTDITWQRYLYPQLKSKERLLGLKGLRGVGKTTLLLQYMKLNPKQQQTTLYVTAEHPYFFENTLLELAEIWSQNEGKLLLIDEVHKYVNWSTELKLIYDGYPNLQVIFTSSSALDLYRGEGDLSRRLATQDLHGLSFREYLSLMHTIDLEPIALEEILNNHTNLTTSITQQLRPLPYFKEYLKSGYFPFAKTLNKNELAPRLVRIINTVLESDLCYIHNLNASNIVKLKRLLSAIASSAPFEPNVSKIAAKLGIGRVTVMNYLKHLHDARLLRLLFKDQKGISVLQKPNKIYFENTNLAFALQSSPEMGAMRETFFANQLENAGHTLALAAKADFEVDGHYIFEVGGKNKTPAQIKETPKAYLVKDDIEHGFGKAIPLWLFGFLY